MKYLRPYRRSPVRRYRFAKAKPRRRVFRKGVLCENATAKGRTRNVLNLQGKIVVKGAAKRGSRISPVGKHWEDKPAVIILSGDRERCNPGTVEGRAEYELRRILMFVRQYCRDVDAVLCCVCRLPISLKEATWEHEFGRHAARIDERLWNPDTQRPQNGVSHLWCNSQRGSRRTEIFHGNNCHLEKEKAA